MAVVSDRKIAVSNASSVTVLDEHFATSGSIAGWNTLGGHSATISWASAGNIKLQTTVQNGNMAFTMPNAANVPYTLNFVNVNATGTNLKALLFDAGSGTVISSVSLTGGMNTINFNVPYSNLTFEIYEAGVPVGTSIVELDDISLTIPANSATSYFTGEVLNATDYYSFGGQMPGRSFTSSSYRYGFNGKENDPESGTQDYGLRIYDPELGKFFSIDPLTASYPFYSPYQFAGNTPIQANDLDGAEPNFKQRLGDAAKRGEISQGFKAKMQSTDIAAQLKGDVNTQMALGVLYATVSAVEGVLALNTTSLNEFGVGLATLYKKASDANPAEPDIAAELLKPDMAKIVDGTLSEKTEGAVNIASLFIPGTQEESAVKTATMADDITIFCASREKRITVPINLEARAKELHSKLDPVKQGFTTVAVLEASNTGGKIDYFVGYSGYYMPGVIKRELKAGEIAVSKVKGHAEVSAIAGAKSQGYTPLKVGVSRPICTGCQQTIKTENVVPMSPLKVDKKAKPITW